MSEVNYISYLNVEEMKQSTKYVLNSDVLVKDLTCKYVFRRFTEMYSNKLTYLIINK